MNAGLLSKHDNKNGCDSYYFGTSDPNPEEGNYLMYDRTTQGNLPNNVKFSNCSSEKIAYFIDAVVNERNGKVNCFTGKCISFDICLNCIEYYGIIFIIGSQCLWVAILAISG